MESDGEESLGAQEERLAVWAKTQGELAEHLNCDRKSLQRWTKEAAADPDQEPTPKKTPMGFNVTLWKLWVERYQKKPSAARRCSSKAELELEKIRLQNRKLEIENAVKEGRLIDEDEVCRVLTELTGAFAQKLRGSKHTLADKVVGVSVAEATKRIDRQHKECLNELALGEWAKKKPFWSTVFAHLSAQLQRLNLGDGVSDT